MRKPGYLGIFALLIMLLALPGAVLAAEQVANGGFDTGDETGWTDSSNAWQVMPVSLGSTNYNIYSCGYPNSPLSQTIDLTNVDTLSFWVAVVSPENRPDVIVSIDGTPVYQKTYSDGDYGDYHSEQINVDTSAYTGTHTVSWSYSAPDEEIWLDDISAESTIPVPEFPIMGFPVLMIGAMGFAAYAYRRE
jgi:hypothetical protein